MKILQVTPTFVPSKFGGTKVFTYELSKMLTARGHEVTVYTTDADIGNSRLSNSCGLKNVDGIKVRYFRNLSNLLAFKYGLFLPLDMILTARRETGNFDIIHFHCYRSFKNIVIHHYAMKYGIPYVLDAHGSTPRVIERKRGLKWLLKWLFDIPFGYRMLRDASICIGETEIGVNEYKEIGVNQNKIMLIPLPLTAEEFSQLPSAGMFRRKYSIKEKHIVMFLGRIHYIKGIDFLVEAFHELSQSRNDVILAIVGPDNGYKSTLEDLINRLNLTNKVLFTGFLGGEEKLSALVDADVVVQTSRYEQGAWAPLEAVLCGTPIIVSKHTGAGEDVKKLDAGYLVEFGNKKKLAELINMILEEPSEAKDKAKKATKYIRENLSMNERVEDYEKLYVRCIEKSRCGERSNK
jgi:glycosyltransferase involved in cell wall biosynthesis